MGLPTAYRLAKALGVPPRAFWAAMELTLDEREERRARELEAERVRREAE
jgi:plasmid maintenance system antidote protein VapI